LFVKTDIRYSKIDVKNIQYRITEVGMLDKLKDIEKTALDSLNSIHFSIFTPAPLLGLSTGDTGGAGGRRVNSAARREHR